MNNLVTYMYRIPLYYANFNTSKKMSVQTSKYYFLRKNIIFI